MAGWARGRARGDSDPGVAEPRTCCRQLERQLPPQHVASAVIVKQFLCEVGGGLGELLVR